MLDPMSALLLAVEKRIRDAVGDPAGKAVGVQDDGQPPPSAGEVYYAVHDGGEQGAGDIAHALEETAGVVVTITLKAGYAPKDRQGRELVTREDSGILARAWAVKDLLHGDWQAIGEANALLGLSNHAGYGWCEPLLFQSRSTVETVGADWFHAEGAGGAPPAGLKVAVSLARARWLSPVGAGG